MNKLNGSLLFSLSVFILLQTAAHAGNVYKCKDQYGNTEYRGQPCDSGHSSTLIKKVQGDDSTSPTDQNTDESGQSENNGYTHIQMSNLLGLWTDTASRNSMSYSWRFTPTHVRHTKPGGHQLNIRYSLTGNTLTFHRDKGPFIPKPFDQVMTIINYGNGVVTLDESGHRWRLYRAR